MLTTDSVATVALGVISSKQGNSGNDSEVHNDLMAFWAPFMLLHLGGQDIITAYAIQDNELWLRHLLGLIVQSSVAFYIFITSLKVSLKDHWLSLLTIPMLVAGFIKYAERILVMRLANDTTEVGSAKVTFQKSCSYIQADLLSWVVLGSPMPNVIETLKMRLSDRTTYPEIEPDNGELVKERLWGFNFLPCAYAVAQKLREKEEQKWEILIKFWVENLARVATLCQGNNHAQQLQKGGEFLSHVWLLIEHMDLQEKFRVPVPVPQQGEQALP
ncbi:uncharacterized protein LOC142630723 isoform X4 [Castanea sativa]|uniref:uncharacterized protein LOC142630723 isoform X4 n=1 Tax=Castanea sativa TaxID=21020 RepID=UPI003F654072